MGQGCQAVPINGRGFEIQLIGSLLHALGKPCFYFPTFTGQEILRLLYQLGIVFLRNFSGARSRAAFDLVKKTGAGSIGVKGIGAGSDQKNSLQGIDRDINRTRIGKGTVVIALPGAGTAIFEQARCLMITAQKDIGKALVIANQDIKAWPQPFDEIGFQQKGFSLGMGSNKLHIRGFRDHAGRSIAPVANSSGVVLHPVAQAFCLPNVQDVTCRIHHSIDAGFTGEATDQIANQLSTGLSCSRVGFLPQDIAGVALPGAWNRLIDGFGVGR